MDDGSISVNCGKCGRSLVVDMRILIDAPTVECEACRELGSPGTPSAREPSVWLERGRCVPAGPQSSGVNNGGGDPLCPGKECFAFSSLCL